MPKVDEQPATSVPRKAVTGTLSPGFAVTATAPKGIDDSIVGAPVGRDFVRLKGDAARSLFAPEAVKKLSQPSVEITTVTMNDRLSLEANISAWMVNVSGSYDASNRFESRRALQVTGFTTIDDAATPQVEAAADAVYYVSKVTWGHSYEAVFEGSARSFGAGVEAKLIKFGGSVDALTKSANLHAHLIGLGLTPKTPDALVAAPERLLEAYEMSPEPVPVLVEYRLITGRPLPENARIEYKPVSTEIRFTTMKVAAEASWGATPWKLSAECRVAHLDRKTTSLLTGQAVDSGQDWTLKVNLPMDTALAEDTLGCTTSGTYEDIATPRTALPDGTSAPVKLAPGIHPLKISAANASSAYTVVAEVEVKPATE